MSASKIHGILLYMMDEIVGHKKQCAFLEKVIEKEQLSHAYCFCGPEHVGKRTIAENVAKFLLADDKASLLQHPDFFVLSQEKNQKTDKTKQFIDVEQVRNLRSFVQKKPLLGNHKVAIIDPAEKMNENAANALLKTLEEPASHSTLILIAKDTALLPQTIVSRCQTLWFGAVSEEEIVQALEKKGISNAKNLAALSHGLPGLAFSWSENAELAENFSKEQNRFFSLFNKPLFQKISAIDELFGDKTDHVAARQNLVQVLNIWQISIRDILLGNINKNIPADSKELIVVFDNIEKAKLALPKNIHPKLVMDQILLSIP